MKDKEMELPVSDNSHSKTVGNSMPRLSEYYCAPKAQPMPFLKEVRNASKSARENRTGQPSFDEKDAAEVLEHLDKFDRTLSKTVKLLGKDPKLVREWVASVTSVAFRRYLGNRNYEAELPVLERFEQFLRLSTDDLLGKDKQRRDHAQNLLRLSFPWLVEKQNLKPEEAFPVIWRTEQKARNRKVDLRRDVRRLLFNLPIPQLKKMSLVSALLATALENEVSARQKISQRLLFSRDEKDALSKELRTIRSELQQVMDERDQLTKRLEETRSQLRDQKELRVIDRTQVKGRTRRFLKDKIVPLISDARDAMEFDPPELEGARQRLDMAKVEIMSELESPDE